MQLPAFEGNIKQEIERIMYTSEEIDQIERHYNWHVRQDSDGNLVWHNSAHAETRWRPVSAEQVAEALNGKQEPPHS
jgi:hypothetical protein